MTQDALAAALGLNDRQTVSDIEKGNRSLKTDELAALCDALDEEMAFFLDPFNVTAEAQYSWRANDNLPGEDLDHFQNIANGWVGMQRWLNRQGERDPSTNDFIALRPSAASSFEQALSFGESMAKFLELGPVPAAKTGRRLSEWSN